MTYQVLYIPSSAGYLPSTVCKMEQRSKLLGNWLTSPSHRSSAPVNSCLFSSPPPSCAFLHIDHILFCNPIKYTKSTNFRDIQYVFMFVSLSNISLNSMNSKGTLLRHGFASIWGSILVQSQLTPSYLAHSVWCIPRLHSSQKHKTRKLLTNQTDSW